MTTKRFAVLLLAALALFLAACKGESPTAPTTPTNPGGGSGSGGVTPPTNAVVTLSVSSANPLVDSTTVISATVTQNNANVPNGTAVQFKTTLGTFSDTGTDTTIRTTTNGVASATLTSSTAGTATITAVVNNVSRTTSVTFQARPVTPPPIDQTPVITSISPATGRPQGGETLTITGRNFRSPVRVLFDTGNGQPKEATPISFSPTQIQVLTPAVDLGAGQQKTATVTVIFEAGTANEFKATAPSQFTYQLETLTPRITTTSPNSGPINGGTRVTIFGDGFQAPVQVLFGSAEAQVVNVAFSQIVVLSPPASATAPGGSGPVTGVVPVTVININSATRATYDTGFRYTPKMQITAAGPTQGPAGGGTRVTIDGIGFDDPVAVTIGGVAAEARRVSGTQIIALTAPVLLSSCTNVAGPITVTNIENGDSATGPQFTYIVPKPAVAGATPSAVLPGGSVTVSVLNAQAGLARITVGDRQLLPTARNENPNGITDFTLTLPNNFTFQTQACTSGGVAGVQNVPLDVNLTYTDVQSGCTDTLTNGLRINPPDTTCRIPPPPAASVTITNPNSGCASAPAVSAASGTSTTTIVVANSAGQGSQSLNITSATSNNPEFAIAPGSATGIAPGAGQTFTITFDPSAVGARSGTVTFTTNDPTRPTINVCVVGNGT